MPQHDPGGKSRIKWPDDSRVTATLSPCDLYRYRLSEIWDPDKPLLAWLMMNPSTADTKFADPTLRKTGTFSRLWGYGGQLVVNVHAYRATYSDWLLRAIDPVGPDNDKVILETALKAKAVVLAYGKPPKPLRPRADLVVSALEQAGLELKYLRLSKDGTPYHPLYLPNNSKPLDWSQRYEN